MKKLWTRGMPYFEARCSGCARRVEAADDPVWIERRGVTTVLCAPCIRQAKPVKNKAGKTTHLTIAVKRLGR